MKELRFGRSLIPLNLTPSFSPSLKNLRVGYPEKKKKTIIHC